ncbi:MAG: metal ABC transporter ATP-binding protein [Verrucomicrobiaceae bacterium]|nr:metal ABC transporter ATP-binding protein [Verrucomicrobiaceae bacterium]
MTTTPALELHDLTVSYAQKPVLYGIDVQVPQRSITGIIGPTGAGKSTMIRAIMGLTPLNGGWVKIFGESFLQSRHRVGYVPQREQVDWDFPVNVMDVVLMGRYGRRGWLRRVTKEDHRIAEESLEKVGMLPFRHRQIANLSGGQQQRVFLARALAQQSDLYLMDEPFAGVDATTERAIVTLLQQLQTEGKTILVVHHDLTTAKEYFDHLLLLNMRLVAFGKTEDVFTVEQLQKTYGGRLTILSDVAAKMSREM